MAQAVPREDNSALGLAIMCLAVTLFTCIDTSAKWLILAGIPALQVVFCRYLGHLVLAFALYLPQEGAEVFRSVNWPIQAARSMFLLFSTILNFSALAYLDLTITTTIMFALPIAVTLLSIPVLGERVGLRRFLAILAGFVGVLIVIQPWGVQFQPAMLLSLGALTSASLYFVLTRKLAGAETTATSQIWSAGVATLCIAPFAVGGWTWPDTTLDAAVLCAIGVFGGTGHIAATVAHRYADASVLSPVTYLQMVMATLASIVIFSVWPTVWTLIGAAVILSCGLYIWRRETAASKERRRMGIAPR